MGIVELIPGVSAGTIALVTGLLPELLSALQKINITAIKVLRASGFKACWQFFNGNFLLILAMGIVTGLAVMAQFVPIILGDYPIQAWSFFFGLILASSIWLSKQIGKRSLLSVFFLAPCFFFAVCHPKQGFLRF